MNIPTQSDLAAAANRQNSREFRRARKEMGLTQVTAFIPDSQRKRFSQFVERLKAEHYLKIATSKSPESTELRALSSRYVVAMPGKAELLQAVNSIDTPEARSLGRRINEHIEQSLIAQNTSKFPGLESSEYYLACASAVAHSTMAAHLWKRLVDKDEDED